MTIVRTALVLAAFVATAAAADAQSLYVEGGAALTWREPGWRQQAIDDTAPTHTATETAVFESGWWLTPSLALEGSIQIQRRQTLSWRYAYMSVSEESSTDRDVPIVGHVRGVAYRRGSVSIEPLVGGGFSRHQSESFTLVSCGSSGVTCVPVMPPRQSGASSTWEPLVSAGVDLPIRAATALHVVPTARLLYMHRRPYLTSVDFRGPSSGLGLMWTIGLALRFSAH